jgi:hypothetical protein
MSILIAAAEMLENEPRSLKSGNQLNGVWQDAPDAQSICYKWKKQQLHYANLTHT